MSRKRSFGKNKLLIYGGIAVVGAIILWKSGILNKFSISKIHAYPANVSEIHARNRARQLANKERVAAILAAKRHGMAGYVDDDDMYAMEDLE